jgi:hypothetical protein
MLFAPDSPSVQTLLQVADQLCTVLRPTLRVYLSRSRRLIVRADEEGVKASWGSQNGDCFVGQRSQERGRMGKPSHFPFLASSQPNAAERSIKRLRHRVAARSGDDNIPFLITVIPLHYGAFGEPTCHQQARCFARFTFCHADPEKTVHRPAENLQRI